MKISDLVLYVRIWLFLAALWFLAAAIERFTYPFRYEGELRATEAPKLKGDCGEVSDDTMIAWRLTADKKAVEYKCPASRPWPFYATATATELPVAIQRALGKQDK